MLLPICSNLLINTGIKSSTLELIGLAGYVAVHLITAVITVNLTITAIVVLYAFTRAASELTLRAVAHLTVQLITAIAAVILIVTAPASRNTLEIVTLEVGGITDLLDLAGGWLILSLGTIVFTITTPAHRNATSRMTTEILGTTGDTITIGLIRFVGTVNITIADPDNGQTTIVATLELILFANDGSTTLLILSIGTIGLIIADKILGNALARRTATLKVLLGAVAHGRTLIAFVPAISNAITNF